MVIKFRILFLDLGTAGDLKEFKIFRGSILLHSNKNIRSLPAIRKLKLFYK